MSTNLNVNITGNAQGLQQALNQVDAGVQKTMSGIDKGAKQATASTQGLADSFSRSRGLIFGLTGMATAGIEAVGMFGMLTDSQQRVTDATNELNQMQAEGVTSGRDYQRATTELEKAQRALRFSIRFTILSFADLIPFALNTINALVKMRSAAPAAAAGLKQVDTATKTLGLSTKTLTTEVGLQTGAVATNRGWWISSAGTFKMVETGAKGATVAVKGLGGAMKAAIAGTGIGLAIIGVSTALEAFAQNWWGAQDAVHSTGQAIGDAVPQLKGLLDILNQIGNAI